MEETDIRYLSIHLFLLSSCMNQLKVCTARTRLWNQLPWVFHKFSKANYICHLLQSKLSRNPFFSLIFITKKKNNLSLLKFLGLLEIILFSMYCQKKRKTIWIVDDFFQFFQDGRSRKTSQLKRWRFKIVNDLWSDVFLERPSYIVFN